MAVGEGAQFAAGSKNKRKKYTRVQIVHFYWLWQVDVISKRENSIWYLGGQLNSQNYLAWFFRLIQVKSIVEDNGYW